MKNILIFALKKFPVGDVWGVGRQLNKLYQKNNIKNAFDLKNCITLGLEKTLMYLA